jgi:CheY-like chemotaxis protein
MVGNAHKILIVDDEDALLLGLSVAMKRRGYQVLIANNRQDGMILAQSELPDLIVSDVMMPPPNGFELRNLLSQNPITAEIPFISLTERIAQRDKLAGIRSGADDDITKRFYRARNVTLAEIPGSGLGFYLVKSIIDELGGDILVSSNEGGGTTFDVRLKTA